MELNGFEEAVKPEGDWKLDVSQYQSQTSSCTFDARLIYDYFSPALMDCWPLIFSYVRERRNLRALTNTCRLFHSMLHIRKMRELVIPILMKNPCFTMSGILSCRFLNKKIKHTVDKFLLQVKPSWIKRSFTLAEARDIQEFIDFTQETNGKSPFLTKQLNIITIDFTSVDLVIILFQQFGHSIKELHLGILHSIRPLPITEALIRALSHLPNVEFLSLRFLEIGHFEEDLDEAEDEWELFNDIPVASFPKLNELTELSISFGNMQHSVFPVPLNSFVGPLVKAYGAQLETFSCSEAVFALDIDVDLCNTHLDNLRKFEIPSLDSAENDMVFEKLSQVAWPNLECLSLGKASAMRFSAYFSAHAFNSFKDMLKELRLGPILDEGAYLSGINPVCINIFPQLTKLVVSPADVYNGIWHVFRFHFVNLEYLRFEPMKREYTPIPSHVELKDYFIMFPYLKKLIWVDGTGDGAYRVKFTRMDLVEATGIHN
ncbi:unnamed protein product [Orchesella dallaii]|uniref:F-box domain-containing protein n=1 Tax=Orchesella dallaii TaxID=48710 RepID=A0ABP1REJ0_9HEXA